MNKQFKNILVTGGAGFIGSNLISFLTEKYSACRIINLDKLTYAADLENLKDVSSRPNYVFIKGDICDEKLIPEIFKAYSVDGVFHLAACSHVDNSIKEPREFVKTNIEGTFNLLSCAYQAWHEGPFKVKAGHEGARFHLVSTDEVYGSAENGRFTESSPVKPNSPYSASKASADLLARAYIKTFGLNVTISNCSNNFGPCQHGEKFIPTVIRCDLSGKNIPIYGDGGNIRDWLYVKDHCEALDLIFRLSAPGETYNIGGGTELDNLTLAKRICALLNKLCPSAEDYSKLISFVEDRPGHDRRYSVDCSKLKKDLGWSARTSFDSALEQTVKWYLRKYDNKIRANTKYARAP